MRPAFLLVAFSCLLFSCKKEKKEPVPNITTALDNRYTVTGTMKDFSNTSYTGYYPHEITLAKNTETQATMVPKDLGIPGHLILVGTSLSYYGNFGIIITVDPATNKITAITNHYGQPAPNGRSATLDPFGVNAWDPVTKEIKIKYWLDEPAVITPHRVSFDETWTYLGPK
jgi:hypothetical protein